MKIEINGCEVDIRKFEELDKIANIVSLIEFEDETFRNYENLPEKLKRGYIGSCYYDSLNGLFLEKKNSNGHPFNISRRDVWVKVSTQNLKEYSEKLEDEIMYIWYPVGYLKLGLILDKLFVNDMRTRYNIEVFDDTDAFDGNKALEYMLNTVIPFKYHFAPDKKKLVSELKSKLEYIESFEEYIPMCGIAQTVFGECLRCCQRIVYRYLNDGDISMNMDGSQISFVNLLAILEKISEEYGETSPETARFVTDFIRVPNEDQDHGQQGSDISELDDILFNEYEEYPFETAVRMAVALCRWKERDISFLSMKNYVDTREYLNGNWA